MTIVNSETHPLEKIFADKYKVDFYQRDYVWGSKHIDDLIRDLSTEFLKNWKPSDSFDDILRYDPYFMGEIVLSIKDGINYIIDGQQRITTLTLLLIYIINKYKHIDDFPIDEIKPLIYKQKGGKKTFNLQIEERKECMEGLYVNGVYDVETDNASVNNIIERYSDFEASWDDNINDGNINMFVYWIMYRVMFSKVWTDSDDFAYVIFETMNDRGLSLTQVEMLRSYLLANISQEKRVEAMNTFDEVTRRLTNIKLSSKSKAEFEFFKMYFRGHYAETLSQSPGSHSDFVRIGKEFHRWVRDNETMLGLKTSDDFVDFMQRIDYYSKAYDKIHTLIQKRNATEYLYLIVNDDYNFTLQPALLLSAIAYKDDEETIEKKIKLLSRYLTKILTWRVWNHWLISQSSLEAPIYELCKQIRSKSIEEIIEILDSEPIELPELEASPRLNQQNKRKIRVLLSLITAIVGDGSKEPQYVLNNDEPQEVEHIWSNHPEEHPGYRSEDEFQTARNNIGDLLVLPKSFNASYGDDPYCDKVKQYFSQNILAQSLSNLKYSNNPGFAKYVNDSGLPFKPYDEFDGTAITERAELYKQILSYNWNPTA
ncbi:DUF262 domain-containing protein [Hornefia butyriciproducens]|uniref:DUF262 domain-containing protein n=1 Tax=Hornefia butyriciproducens TaxID=2652293 RepID=UPI002A914779|nr:DUF262 domain-containing protein [Hornefia butyriciproducens]MDY5423432.1 DUF262 domain-containing protein [Hornefia butyriciproducens]